MIHGLFRLILINHSDPACVTLCAGKSVSRNVSTIFIASPVPSHAHPLPEYWHRRRVALTEAISADSRTNPFIAVGCNGNADTGATDQNTSIASSLLNLFYYFCVHRIVYRIL